MRQALHELEVTYDAVGAFSVTVDAHKAVRDVTQVFYEEDRQVLLTEVEKGFELRPESSRRPPRHRRDACSMAWRCRFFAARRSQRGHVIAEK